jgi:hypothetical protein
MDIPNHAELLEKVEAFCARHDMAETRFGREAVSNPNFITGLRRDPPVSPTLKTLNEVCAFMERIDGDARLKLRAEELADTPLLEEEQQLPFCSAPGDRPGVSSPTSSPTTAPPTSSAATASCPACSDPAAVGAAAADAGASPNPSCSTPDRSSPSAAPPRAAETLAGAEDQTPLRSGGTDDRERESSLSAPSRPTAG